MQKAQLSIEFISMTVMGFFLLFTFLAIVMSISESHSKESAHAELTELSSTLQQEFLLASAVHEGYTRTFSLPKKLGSHDYTISSGLTPNGNASYITFIMDPYQSSIEVPVFSGTLAKGENTLTKHNGSLEVIQ